MICHKCQVDKLSDDFWSSTQCRACHNEYQREWDKRTGRRAHKKHVASGKKNEYWRRVRDEALPKRRKYYSENKERILADQKRYAQSERGRSVDAAYRQRNREQILEWKRASYQRNKDTQKSWRQRNRDNVLKSKRDSARRCINTIKAYRQSHRDQEREARRKDYQVNKDKYMLWQRARKAKLKGATGAITLKEWRGLKNQFGNRCLACWETKPLTLDHIIPVTKGGMNSIANAQPLCLSCNASKKIEVVDYRPFAVLKLAAMA